VSKVLVRERSHVSSSSSSSSSSRVTAGSAR
jgi:hypothetical protein